MAVLRRGFRFFLQNVVLLGDQEGNPDRFHFRFGCMETASFEALDTWQQDTLRDLYHHFFFDRQDAIWKHNALRTLPPLLEASQGMLVCGEDLGLIPACVPKVMRDLGILGLRIQRMPSDAMEGEFGDTTRYPYHAVASPSCHDMLPLRAWWEEDEHRAQRLWERDYAHEGCVAEGGTEALPPKECRPEVAAAIMRGHLESPACIVIVPIQDLFALDAKYSTRPAMEERINDPTKSKHYW